MNPLPLVKVPPWSAAGPAPLEALIESLYAASNRRMVVVVAPDAGILITYQ